LSWIILAANETTCGVSAKYLTSQTSVFDNIEPRFDFFFQMFKSFKFKLLASFHLIPLVLSQLSSTPMHIASLNCGDLKSIPLTNLDATQQQMTMALNYTSVTWQQTGGNPVEHNGFSYLSAQQQQAATALGYPGDCWNCKVSKYEGLYWDEMGEGIKQAWGVLGWNKSNWEEGGAYPASESKYWNQLTQAEKDAASTVCYTQMSWDNWIPAPS
jgi:hypothetical protein